LPARVVVRKGAALCAVALVALACARRPAPEPLSTLPDFSLVERDGSTVTLATLRGAPWIADFIFTHCALYCPRLTARMKKLRADLPAGVRTVSITVDPARDTPAVLSAYADSWQAEGRSWLFLTGDKDPIWTLIRKGFLLPVEENPDVEASPILHSNRFALVDSAGRLRGTYEAFDEEAMTRLRADLEAVMREESR
jgi:cytochrome oxidase Cu insertion factor (SCO1/SenC/PrrC family)